MSLCSAPGTRASRGAGDADGSFPAPQHPRPRGSGKWLHVRRECVGGGEHEVGAAGWRAWPPGPEASRRHGRGGRGGAGGARPSSQGRRLPGRRGGGRLFTQEGCADSTFLEFTLLSLSLL